MKQCRAVTGSRQQCTRSIEDGENYCWQHKDSCKTEDSAAPHSEEHRAWKVVGGFLGSVAASLGANVIYDAIKGDGSPSKSRTPDDAPAVPPPSESIVGELAKYGVKITSDLRERPPYLFEIAAREGESSNQVGWANDLSDLLRQMREAGSGAEQDRSANGSQPTASLEIMRTPQATGSRD